MSNLRFALACFGIAIFSSLPAASYAQVYPSRPIKMVVGYAAGGPVDTVARRIAPYLHAKLGQPIIVENRPGASGIVGSASVAKSEPDGYTLAFVASPTQTMTPHFQKNMPFDPLRDYTPISLVVGYATVLLVNKNFPADSVSKLIAYAKANPGKITFGSAGNGASNHLAGELVKKIAGVDMLHVPYKGNAPALFDVIGNKINFMFNSIGDSIGYIGSGQLRALAVASKNRNRALPDVPTMIESGLPGFDVTIWDALEAPPGLPAPIVSTLNAAVRASLADPGLAKQFFDLGFEAMPSTPEELAARIKTDYDLWGGVAKDIKME